MRAEPDQDLLLGMIRASREGDADRNAKVTGQVQCPEFAAALSQKGPELAKIGLVEAV